MRGSGLQTRDTVSRSSPILRSAPLSWARQAASCVSIGAYRASGALRQPVRSPAGQSPGSPLSQGCSAHRSALRQPTSPLCVLQRPAPHPRAPQQLLKTATMHGLQTLQLRQQQAAPLRGSQPQGLAGARRLPGRRSPPAVVAAAGRVSGGQGGLAAACDQLVAGLCTHSPHAVACLTACHAAGPGAAAAAPAARVRMAGARRRRGESCRRGAQLLPQAAIVPVGQQLFRSAPPSSVRNAAGRPVTRPAGRPGPAPGRRRLWVWPALRGVGGAARGRPPLPPRGAVGCHRHQVSRPPASCRYLVTRRWQPAPAAHSAGSGPPRPPARLHSPRPTQLPN